MQVLFFVEDVGEVEAVFVFVVDLVGGEFLQVALVQDGVVREGAELDVDEIHELDVEEAEDEIVLELLGGQEDVETFGEDA